jgi:hydroxyacylglutathione hydrolase
MIFQAFMTDVHESNVYVVACEECREGILVDAGDADKRIVQFARDNGLRITTIFITHDHYDHTGGVDALAAALGVEKVLSGSGSAGGRLAHKVGHGDKVTFGRTEGTVLATPGHTSDSISLAIPGMVFTGDALFSGSVGGTGSSAQAAQQIAHLKKDVLSLPDDYEIHPGHGPSSTVSVERRFNPFLV